MADEATPAKPNGEEKERQEFCKKSYDEDTQTFVFAFANGSELKVGKKEIPPQTWEDLAVHGALQKIGDSYASAKGDFALGIGKAQAVIDALKSGTWTVGRESGPRLSDLAEAVARLKQKPLAEALETVKALTEDELLGLRTHPAVKVALADIRAEKARAAFGQAAATPLNIPGL